MTYVLAQQHVMAMAAADVGGIGSAIDDANAAAAAQTTLMPAAAADEVSEASSALFNAYAQEWQVVVKPAASFHGKFVQALAAAGNAYAETEAASLGALTATAAEKPPFTFPTNYATVFISGSGLPTPLPGYMTAVFGSYVLPNFPNGSLANAVALFTPAGLYPLTGTKVLTLNESVAQGVSILDSTLLGTGLGQHGLIQPGGTPVVVQGISQGAIIASLEMEKLATLAGPPTGSQLGFVLLGDPMNPNGGLFERFAGLNFPSLGQTFYGATPSNTSWPTTIYSLEYDGIADWPRYPLDVFSDLNAFAGFYYVHPMYPGLNPAALPPGYHLVQLPTSPGYGGNTTYYMITNPNLPLLDPVRAIPLVGKPIADLLQPDLTVLVNIGYGDPAYGYSTAPANVPTPFGLFPHVDPRVVAADLVAGTQRGLGAFRTDLAGITLSDITKVLTPHVPSPGPLPTLTSIANHFTSAFSKVQPTVDIATALVTAVPAYDATLFWEGISQAVNGAPVEGLINAIGMPIAADVGLVTLLMGYEIFVLTGAWYPPPTPL